MKRLLISTVAGLSLFVGLVAFVACSGGDDTKIPDASDTGVKDTGLDCGPTNVGTLHCREGAPGKACGNSDQPPIKEDPNAYCTMFKCGPGMTKLETCGCNAESQKVDAGDDCPGGSQDSGATD